MKRVIRLGDPTNHGGNVVSGSPTSVIFDKPVARLGDQVSCPKQGHSNCVIAEGDPEWLVDGKPVALEGHKTSCGAALISTLGMLNRDWESSAAVISNTQRMAGKSTSAHLFNDKFRLLDEEGHPIANAEYMLIRADGSQESGTTDADGQTHMLNDEAVAEQVTIHLGDF